MADLISKIQRESFPSEQIRILKSYSSGKLSGREVAQIIEFIALPSDKIMALSVITPKMKRISGRKGKLIIDAFNYDQVKAIKIIAPNLKSKDKHLVLDSLTYHCDREKASRILDITIPSRKGEERSVCHHSTQTNPVPKIKCPPQEGRHFLISRELSSSQNHLAFSTSLSPSSRNLSSSARYLSSSQEHLSSTRYLSPSSKPLSSSMKGCSSSARDLPALHAYSSSRQSSRAYGD